MSPENIVKLLKILKAQNISIHDEWVRCSCLFAKYKHKSGKDSNPSSGFSLDKGRHHYNCFSCHSSGSFDDVLFELKYLHKTHGTAFPEFASALAFLEDTDLFSFDPLEYTETAPPEFFEFPSAWLESFSPVSSSSAATAYLDGRNVPEQVRLDFDLRFDNAKQMVLFPFYNAYGKLAGARGRSIDHKVNKEYRHHNYSYQKKHNTSLVWFRESKLDGSKPLIVVEGQFDTARVYQQYRNVTGILTSGVSEKKLTKLLCFPEVLWFTDNDEAGQSSRDKVRSFFKKNNVKFNDIFVPEEYKDPDQIPPKLLKYLLKEFVVLDELIL